MNMNFNKILFNYVMILGIILSLSANNLLMMWTGMELSTMAIMPLIPNKNSMSSESSVKYYIIQSISSAVMMLGVLLLLTNSEIEYKMVLTSSMMLKMGVAPLHNWIIEMIESTELYTMFMILSLMKIAPMNLISYLTMNLNLFIIISLIVGSIMGINQNSFRKIMCYSSIFNLSFMLSTINISAVWWMYFLLYSMMLGMIILFMNYMKISYLNQMMMNEKKMSLKLNFWILMLAMGGMPPMTGFMLKFMVIQTMMLNKEFLLSILMMMTSMFVMFYYLKMTFISVMMSSSMMKWNIMKSSNSPTIFILINMIMFPFLLALKT